MIGLENDGADLGFDADELQRFEGFDGFADARAADRKLLGQLFFGG